MKDAEPPRWNKGGICFQSVEPSVRREQRDKRDHPLTRGVRAKLILWKTEKRKRAEGRISFKNLTTKGYGLYETGSDFYQLPASLLLRGHCDRPNLVGWATGPLWFGRDSLPHTPQETIVTDRTIFFLFSRTLKSTPMNPSYKWIVWIQS